MRNRVGFCIAALGACVSAQAGWTVVYLQPSGSTSSAAYTVSGNQQGGAASFTFGQDFQTRAGFWSGSAGSWVNLHPSGAIGSSVSALDGNRQYGEVAYDMVQSHAGYWEGTSGSFTRLKPFPECQWSRIEGAGGGMQVGSAYTGSTTVASLWAGSAASWVNLNPAGATSSEAKDTDGAVQVGFARFSDVNHAGMWQGTAASWVDLHPPGATSSSLFAIFGNRQGGGASIASQPHAGIWSGTPGSFVDLHPPTMRQSFLTAMSADYQVGSGNVLNKVNNHALLWSGTRESVVDLHQYLPVGCKNSYATDVFSDGEYDYVVGYATFAPDDFNQAVMWKRPAAPFGFSLNKASVAGQNYVQGTIRLPDPMAAAVTITTYDNSSLVTTPPSVTLAAGTTERNFAITVQAVNSTINTTVFAKWGGVTRSRALTLVPLIPTALAFTPNPVTGGQNLEGRVVINGVAGPSGRTISLFDNSAYSSVPASVIVPPGASQATFTITTVPVTSQKVVVVTARVSAGEKSGTFRINP